MYVRNEVNVRNPGSFLPVPRCDGAALCLPQSVPVLRSGRSEQDAGHVPTCGFHVDDKKRRQAAWVHM